MTLCPFEENTFAFVLMEAKTKQDNIDKAHPLQLQMSRSIQETLSAQTDKVDKATPEFDEAGQLDQLDQCNSKRKLQYI